MNKTTTFIDRATTIHGTTYDYSEVVYINSSTKVPIKCHTHGTFLQSPDSHLAGRGCQLCGRERSRQAKFSDTATFITKAIEVHGDRYLYHNTNYVTAKEKLIITCPIHGDFEQLASGHLSGYGCSKCTNYGKGRVSPTSACTLYYFKIVGTDLHKLGITTREIHNRYRSKFDLEQIDMVFTLEFSSGSDAYTIEQALFKQFSSSRYYGERVLSSGNTEIFITDIFNGSYPTKEDLLNYIKDTA